MEIRELDDYILTKEQALVLENLGYDFSSSVFIWTNELNKNEWVYEQFNFFRTYNASTIIHTPLLEELLDALPGQIEYEGKNYFLNLSSDGFCFKTNNGDLLQNLILTGPNKLSIVYNAAIWIGENGWNKQPKNKTTQLKGNEQDTKKLEDEL